MKQNNKKIKLFLDNSFFNFQTMPGVPFDQSHFVKLLTKMMVGASTAVWSFIELKDYIKLTKKYKDVYK